MSWLRGRREGLMGTVLYWTLVPLAITLLAWQPLQLEPGTGLTLSWMAGIEMAVHRGIPFGSHLVFTYGPLGFLSVSQVWYAHLAELSFAYTALIRFGLAAALFVASRRTFGGVAAFVIASVVASVDNQIPETVIVLILAVWAITRGVDGRLALGLAVASGAFAGIEFLNKASIGISLAAMTAILVLSLPGPRRAYAAAAAAGLGFGLLAGWAATGQVFTALPDYLVNSARIVSGYAAAMGVADPTLGWQYTAAFVGLAFGLWGAWHMTAMATARQRWGIVGLWVAFWFFAFKEAFVRQDSFHGAIFFEALVAGFLAFHWRKGHRRSALASTAALLVFALAAQSVSLTTDFNPSGNVTAAFDELRSVASSSRRAAIIAAGRRLIVGSEPVDAQSLSLLRGRTVEVFPWEIALAWAYGLRWDPLPVLQSYSAYTAGLDRLDADFLASSRAPQRIVEYFQQGVADIDGRVLSFDQGLTSRAILCRYRSLRATTALDVLGLGPNRCSAPSLLETVHADWYQTVSVPPPPDNHSLVLVRIGGVGVGGFERVRALFWKPALRFVVLNRGPPQRLVTGTAEDGLPLRASRGVDFPAPFSIAPGVTTIAVAKDGQQPTGGRPITYTFYWQSIDPAARSQPGRSPALTGSP